MRTTAMLLVLMLVSPVAASIGEGQNYDIDFEIDGENILPTYSRAVQLAFDRVENLEQYTDDELSQTNQWLVVTQIPIDKQSLTLAKPESVETAPILRGAYIWYFENPLEAIDDLEMLLQICHIESYSPMVERQQFPRDKPNDPEFSSQWHLENTGQTSGLSGEDINATDVWDNYRGEGIVISSR